MFAKRFVLFLFALACLSQAANAALYSSVVVYGDSLSDNGNLYAATGGTIPGVPYYNGRRSNGPVAVEYLAQRLGAPLVDLAWIGATTGVGGYDRVGGSVTSLGASNLPGMSTYYAATKSSIAPIASSSLFVVWGGPNDWLAPSPLDGGNPAAIITRAVTNLVAIIADLKAMGAKAILAPGMPDLGLTPFVTASGSAAATQASAFTDAFNAALVANLPSGVLYFDTAGLSRAIAADPAAYGLTNVTSPCFDGATVCGSQGEYFFFDDFHPTTAVHDIFGQSFYAAVIPEPATLWLLLAGMGLIGLRRRMV